MSLRLRLFATCTGLIIASLLVGLLVSGAPLHEEVLIVVVAGVVGLVLSFIVSGVAVRPLRRLSRAVERAAAGEAGIIVEAPQGDEFGDLVRAFNDLSVSVRRWAVDADESRSEVRESVLRLGEALRSTHDLRKLLSVVLETALVAVRGRSGAVYLLTARRDEVYVKVGRRLDPDAAARRIPVGSGLAGWVADRRETIALPSGRVDAPVPEDPEPIEATSLAVPLETQSQLMGVLAIYGRDAPESFGEPDLEIIRSLARAAGVGIENVLLHQEAQRLSVTDGMTGVWNRRYMQMSLLREFERAMRFQRPLSLMMIDIDHFKKINDKYGHQRADAVLIELARRIVSHTRTSIDVLARYGGEEFVLILPETDITGARAVAEKIRSEIADTPFGAEDETRIPVTVSVGYAVYPEHGLTANVLVDSADKAMYEAKGRGRNLVVGAEELGGMPTLARDPVRP